jgi:16S rRNA C967 or C1407 C5-methylase (RsmB/RsmF family)
MLADMCYRLGLAAKFLKYYDVLFVKYASLACRVHGGLQSILQSRLFREGDISIQDQAAGLVVHLLDPQPGEAILDVCAAPGGKAIYSALRMQHMHHGREAGGKQLVAMTTGQSVQVSQARRHGQSGVKESEGVGRSARGADVILEGQQVAAQVAGLVVAVDVSPSRLQLVQKAARVQGVQHMVSTLAGDLRDMISQRSAAALALYGPCSATVCGTSVVHGC